MNVFRKLALLRKLNGPANQIEDGMKTKNATKIVAGIIAAMTAIMQVPEVQHAITSALAAHPAVSSAVAGITAIIALLHNPKTEGQ